MDETNSFGLSTIGQIAVNAHDIDRSVEIVRVYGNLSNRRQTKAICFVHFFLQPREVSCFTIFAHFTFADY